MYIKRGPLSPRAGSIAGTRTLNGRIILVHEVGLDELNSQGTLSDTTTTDDDELVLAEELAL